MNEAELGGFPTNPTTGETIAGRIGRDILDKMAVGLDILAGEWTFWSGGHLEPADADAWIRGAAPWPKIEALDGSG